MFLKLFYLLHSNYFSPLPIQYFLRELKICYNWWTFCISSKKYWNCIIWNQSKESFAISYRRKFLYRIITLKRLDDLITFWKWCHHSWLHSTIPDCSQIKREAKNNLQLQWGQLGFWSMEEVDHLEEGNDKTFLYCWHKNYMDIDETFRQTRVPNNWWATPLFHFLESIPLNYWQRMSNFHKDVVRSMVEES